MRAGGRHSASLSAIAFWTSLALHGGAAVGVWRAEARLLSARDRALEIEIREPPPPPPEIRPEPPRPPEPPPPEPARPRLVARRVPQSEPVPRETPPPPNQEPPPEAPKDAPPVFGVTMSSVVSGESAVAVPIGNTTMTKDRTPRAPAAVQAYTGEGTQPFQPVPDVYVSTRPKVLYEVNSADVYPADAKNLGLEGSVLLSVGLDAKGAVVEVKVIGRAGHGFDEAAARALRKFRFSPALTSDGRAVPYRLTYTYRFEMDE